MTSHRKSLFILDVWWCWCVRLSILIAFILRVFASGWMESLHYFGRRRRINTTKRTHAHVLCVPDKAKTYISGSIEWRIKEETAVNRTIWKCGNEAFSKCIQECFMCTNTGIAAEKDSHRTAFDAWDANHIVDGTKPIALGIEQPLQFTSISHFEQRLQNQRELRVTVTKQMVHLISE